MSNLSDILKANDIKEVNETWLDDVANGDITEQLEKDLMDFFSEDLENEDTYVELADLLFDHIFDGFLS